ncbi:Glycosyltransferase involved in cell wall bisynthesis [Polaribacter sp. Hel1_33_78]|jgi:glycosyltransferase involved in cell wall biosynthesis|uniref:glycosyltransferase family 4 protein n=1 Tax=Polaribacter sp. Hel1_33_78 TaxID=1336804 RepID=UPI00087A4C2C|nr:glycosyltransferase family 4 protein [Polaribacter sp. Hel1_33_78]SDU24245.1 Glycosyltransferase involved in cell wall bisynthesis [Polaribacter sp. Hel1_33_78]
MKIAIINTLYAPNKVGGAEKSVQALAENFSALGNDIIVICLGKEDVSYKLNGVTIYTVKIKNDYWPFDTANKSSFEKLKWHLKDASNNKYNDFLHNLFLSYKPDVLFTNNISGFSTKVWRTASNLNIKIVHTLRDYYLQCPKTTKFKGNLNCLTLCNDCKLLSLPKKKDSSKINYLIGISNYILNDHIDKGYFNGVENEVIFNGFEIPEKKIPEKKNTNTFGFIGQVNESKGIELILESFSKISSSSWRFLIAGAVDEKYLKQLNKINSSVQIEYLGYMDSSKFFEMIDVLIVPSLWNEPFGRVVLESIINKKPVIASDKGGIPEILSNNKQFIFSPKVNELTVLLEKIIANSNFLDEFKFENKYLEKFTIKNTVQKYLEVFNKIIRD